MPGVPYQTMSTRPSSPAAIHVNTLLCRVPAEEPDVSICMGVDQVFPSSVENEYFRTVSPVTLPLPSIGACDQTAYRLPALSIAMVGKFAPVMKPVKVATGKLSRFKPLG